MKTKSLRKNVFYNILRSINSVIFPLITFSYVTHVLNAESMGKLDFIKSYTTYFTILAMLGSVNYATREAAKIRDNRQSLSRFSHEILIINLASVIVSYIFFFALVYTLPRLKLYHSLLLINSLTIILTAMGMDWLYNAVEDYKYIAIRSSIVQLISLVTTLMFVKSEDDFLVYAFISVMATAGANIFNILHSTKYVDYVWMKNYYFKKHLKNIMILFGMTICVQIYTHIDVTMLGFMVGDNSVGLYSVATKMANVTFLLIISITAVLTPRISYYYQKRKWDEIERLSYKAINYILLLGIPAMIGLILLASEIINIFNGNSYIEATNTAKIMALRVLLVPLNTFLMIHLFIPLGKEKENMITTLVAVLGNVILNIFLIPVFAQNGAAIATVTTEIIQLGINCIFMRNIIKPGIIFASLHQYCIASLTIYPIYCFLSYFTNGFSLLLILLPMSIIVYFAILIIFRNAEVVNIWDKIKLKILIY